MKKALLFLLVGTFALLGTAAAQTLSVVTDNDGVIDATQAPQNTVRINVPNVLALRLIGADDGEVVFNILEQDIFDAADLAADGDPATNFFAVPVSADLDEVQVLTNDPDGVTVTASVSAGTAVPGISVNDIKYGTATLNNATFTQTSKTGGFVTAFDFVNNAWRLLLDGDEEQGNGEYTVTYTASNL